MYIIQLQSIFFSVPLNPSLILRWVHSGYIPAIGSLQSLFIETRRKRVCQKLTAYMFVWIRELNSCLFFEKFVHPTSHAGRVVFSILTRKFFQLFDVVIRRLHFCFNHSLYIGHFSGITLHSCQLAKNWSNHSVFQPMRSNEKLFYLSIIGVWNHPRNSNQGGVEHYSMRSGLIGFGSKNNACLDSQLIRFVRSDLSFQCRIESSLLV